MFTVVLMVILSVCVRVVFFGKYLASPEDSQIVLCLTFIMDSTMNLMNGSHHDCERRENVPMECLRITCAFLYFVSVKLPELLFYFL